MSVALDIFGPAALVSLIVALAVSFVSRRMLPVMATERYLLPIALAAAFFTGYLVLHLLLPRNVPLIPDQPWHRLPYLGLAAATISAAAAAANRTIIRRVVLLVLALLVGLALAPSWPIYDLPRWGVILTIGLYSFLLASLLDALPNRWLGPTFAGLAGVTGIVLSLAIGAFLSLRFAQLAAMAVGAFIGVWIGCVIPSPNPPPSLRAVVPLFVALIGGLAIVGCVEPDPPLLGFLAVPLAPLVLWGLAVR